MSILDLWPFRTRKETAQAVDDLADVRAQVSKGIRELEAAITEAARTDVQRKEN